MANNTTNNHQFKKPKFLYSEDSMKRALTAVENGMALLQASKMYGVPRSTLVYKSTGKSPVERKMGPKPVLSEEHEKLLENWIIQMAKRGFPIVKWDLMSSVEKIVRAMGIANPFTDGKPGRKWLDLFLKRHPSISKRVVEKLTTSRAAVTESDLRKWFDDTKSLLIEEDHFDILKDPNRVFNTDESAFMLCPKSAKVLGVRGQKNVIEITGANEKESSTVLITGNAAGQIAPTMIVFPYVRIPAELVKTVPSEWAVGKSDKGWMNSENFYEYITNCFHPWLVSSGIQMPVMLFLDGHSSHLTLHLSKFCSENGIILLSLYPNATHIMQPLDVAVFRPLKLGWQKTVHAWKMENIHQHLTKYNFAPLLDRTIRDYLKENTLINGFRLCGLCPFDADAVDYSKCAHTSPKITTVTHQQHTQRLESHLMYLEGKMKAETVTHFNEFFSKNRKEEWIGENKELYHVWKAFKLDKTPRSLSPSTCIAKDPLREVSNLTIPEVQEPTPSTSRIVETDEEIVAVFNINEITPTKQQTTLDSGNITPPISLSIVTEKKENSSDKLAKIISPSTDGKGVPTPFKKVLFWPGTPPKKKRKVNNEFKIPSVVSSKLWQDYFEKKGKEKKEKERIVLEKRAERERKKIEKEKQKRKVLTDSDSSDSENISYAESDNETLSEIMGQYRAEDREKETEENNISPQLGHWVLVQLLTEKNKKQHYVAKIIGKEDNVFTIKYLKKKSADSSSFIWPSHDDISDVTYKDIIQILPEPSVGRRGEINFSVSFTTFNIC